MLAGFSIAEATRIFGRPRGISADRFDLACKPAKTVQAAFLKRFAGARETARLDPPPSQLQADREAQAPGFGRLRCLRHDRR